MELFEEVQNSSYIWKLFYLLNDIPCDDEESKTVIQHIDDIELMKVCVTGIGVNIADEERLLTKCKGIRIFTREIELALLAGDKEMYLYTPSDGGDFPGVSQLGIVGKYIYIGEHEIASPVFVKAGELYTDSYFKSLHEYILNKDMETDGYRTLYKDKCFEIYYGEEQLMYLKNTDISLTYPFVLYLLTKLAEKRQDSGFENGYQINRIKRKE